MKVAAIDSDDLHRFILDAILRGYRAGWRRGVEDESQRGAPFEGSKPDPIVEANDIAEIIDERAKAGGCTLPPPPTSVMRRALDDLPK